MIYEVRADIAPLLRRIRDTVELIIFEPSKDIYVRV